MWELLGGNGVSRDPVAALKKFRLDQLRLATQIKAHAEAAPYPHVAQRLNQIAEAKMKICETLQQTLRGLGVYTDANPAVEIKSGGNHWSRMAQDVQDQAALEQALRETSALLLQEAPKVSELLSDMILPERAHREILTDLLMRADPQAHQI
jgi:hypothetical protein